MNIRQNKIDKLEELRKLSVFTQLETLVIANNLVIDKLGENWLFHVLPSFRGLKRINKVLLSTPVLEKLFYFQKEKWELEVEKEREKEKEKEESTE